MMTRKLNILGVLLLLAVLLNAQLPLFNTYPVYQDNDLGLTYNGSFSNFRIWSPVAQQAELLLYETGEGGSPIRIIKMNKSSGGSWLVKLPGYPAHKFYVFRVLIAGSWSEEIPDPYMKITGINGRRGFIADLKKTNPAGWDKDKTVPLLQPTDAIIYELHIRDATIAANSGIAHKGLFEGLAEKGTRNNEGFSTGLDHLKELGVTHIHLLPFFDFNSIDEAGRGPKYNWGYDPLNYNVPEGSYSSNPADPLARIKELKRLIQTLHSNGLNVVMDVVYNHTAVSEKSGFNQLVPGYYYRHNRDGKPSNATACGNETASERTMMRKFMLESMKYWVKEYHVDGFRIDLMGVHDIVTMNSISKQLHELKPGILLYGEGWTAGASPLPESKRALKKQAGKLNQIAVFSDDIRDAIKGSVFDHKDRGFVSGKAGMEESIKFGVVASCRHPQIKYGLLNYSKAPYSTQPWQTISYCDCHDNHTLWDKLTISAGEVPVEERKKMQQLALAIVLTAQGVSFLHAGAEFLRSKKGIENSFDSPDSINAIDWKLKTDNRDIVDYVKALIKMRKAHPAFHMNTAALIVANLHFRENLPAHLVAYSINGAAVRDTWKKIFVVYNGGENDEQLKLPPGRWTLFSDGAIIKSQIFSGDIQAKHRTCSIYFSS